MFVKWMLKYYGLNDTENLTITSMCLKECLCFLEHVLLHRLKNLCQLCCNVIKRNYDLFSCITTNDNRLIILNILRSDLNYR